MVEYKDRLLELEELVKNKKELFLQNNMDKPEKDYFFKQIKEKLSFFEENLLINQENENFSIKRFKKYSESIINFEKDGLENEGLNEESDFHNDYRLNENTIRKDKNLTFK
jgi:hypothetical protein